MWKHGGCSESVQQHAITYCSLSECHDFGTCEMCTRAEGTETISTNATQGRVARLWYFCGGTEYRIFCCYNVDLKSLYSVTLLVGHLSILFRLP
jgi:hypothetical protein